MYTETVPESLLKEETNIPPHQRSHHHVNMQSLSASPKTSSSTSALDRAIAKSIVEAKECFEAANCKINFYYSIIND